MLDLYLVRHGDANDTPPPGLVGDAARHLSARGLAQAAAVARGLRAAAVKPAQIWHSPLTRAVQTAEAIAAALGAPLIEDPALVPEAPPVLVAERLKQQRGVIVVVAHLPILPGITMVLGLPRVGFATATAAHIRITTDQTVVADTRATLSAVYPVEHWERLEQT
jgi:phosphohistidine phosphatase